LKSLKDKVFLVRQFSPADWLALAEAWWRLFFFYLALRWMSYKRLMISISPTAEKNPDLSHALILAQQLHRLVEFSSRLHFVPMTCLVKSLVLQKMLNDQNISSQVKIGAQKIQDTMYAHAWVEVNGKPIGESDDIAEKFHVFEPA
jgi:hypothetical protein